MNVMMLADHPQDLHDPRKMTTHNTKNDVETPAANNERRTPDDEGDGGGGRAILVSTAYNTFSRQPGGPKYIS